VVAHMTLSYRRHGLGLPPSNGRWSSIRSARPSNLAAILTVLLVVSVACTREQPPSSSASPSTTQEPTSGLCQPSEPECIGRLAPGIHTTANLLTPVTFEVPDGWSKMLDVPGSLHLVSSAFPTAHVGIRPDWAIANQTRCTSDPEPGLGRAIVDLVTWLTEHPGLITSRARAVALGGLEGQVLDVRKDRDWKGPCKGMVSLFTHAGTIDDPGWWDVNNSARLRLFFLDAGGGHVVTVHVETGGEERFQDFLEVAMPIAESFEFG